MQMTQIEVMTYSGRKGDEQPRAFTFAGRLITIVRTEQQWLEEDWETRMTLHCFRIRGDDGSSHCLCLNQQDGEWYYRSSR